jgi:hypothetical protein
MKLGREVAVVEYNKLCDIIGITEDKRIVPDLTDSELFELENNDRLTDEFIENKKELSDSTRETLLSAFMEGTISINDKNRLVHKLKKPICQKNTNVVVLSELVYEPDYRLMDLERNTKGIEPNNFIAMLTALIATYTGQSRELLGRMYKADFQICKTINVLFQNATN